MQKFFEYRLDEDIDLITRYLGSAMTGKTKVVGCINPHSFVVAQEDEAFHKALMNCDYLLPDGEGICMMLKKYRKVEVAKIAGDELHRHILTYLGRNCGKVFYMGSNDHVLELIKKRIAKEFPTVTVKTLSPSYCDELSREESSEIVSIINGFAPDVLFVSMTAPKQEKWVEKYRKELTGVKLVASIGAVFDFYAGTVKRAPSWALKLHLEWLVRLIKEPRRMWKRNFISLPRYLHYVKQNHHKM